MNEKLSCFWCGGNHESQGCQNKTKRAGVLCDCGSRNTFYTGFGGSQDSDASRGMQAIEGDEVYCESCSRTFWY